MTVTKSAHDADPMGLFETPEWATRALLRHLPIAGRTVWEPAAGRHALARVLHREGAMVVTSDLFRYGRRHDFTFDFFSLEVDNFGTAADADVIVTNPPYGRGNRAAVRFAELALERCRGWVALLLTAKFDHGSTRVHLFRDCRRFRFKIALLDRLAFFDGKSGTEDHAWYVWGPSGRMVRPTMFWEGKSP